MDAANIDLKSYNESFYRREIGGFIHAVLEFTRLATKLCHVEITTLIIPGKNNSESELEEMARFVASLDPNIPYHLSAYYPTYHYTYEATTSDQIDAALAIARKHLNYVYPGNLPGPSTTTCAACGAVLVERRGYRVSMPGIRNGRCASCGEPAPIILE
jgi:pyruvate formate lyase activating enzyme